MANNSSFRWVKWTLILAVLAGAAYGGVRYFRRGQDTAAQFQTAPVTRGTLTQSVTASGTLNPVLNVQVGSQVSGIILQLNVDFNSLVKSNQVIAQIDPATYEANLRSAEAELSNVKASLELAQLNARRAEELLKDKLIATSEYDQAMATLHQSEAQVKIREASVERVKVDLARCTIYAPVDGVVISRNVDVGQTVAASLSAPILFLIANDLSKMQINAAVAEADVGGIEMGQEVEFTVDAFPYRTFRGKVTQVRNSPIVLQNVVTYDTIIEVSNPDLKLKPGMTANVSIIIAQQEDVLRVPNAALRFRPPDVAAAESRTNLQAMAQASRQSGGGGGFRGEGGGRRGGRGEGGGRGGGGAGGRPRSERQAPRTVYVMPAELAAQKEKIDSKLLKPVQVRSGISDGIMTEVAEGLNEGDLVVTGTSTSVTAQNQAGSRPTNPFGGGRGRF